MTHVAEFTTPPTSFPFGKTLEARQNVEITVDQIIPTDEAALPFFWVRGCHPEEFLELAEQEPDVSAVYLLEEVDEVGLFKAQWKPDAAIIGGLKQLDLTIVETVGTAEHWRFEVRAEDRETFNSFQDVFEAQGRPIDLTRLYDLDELIDGSHRNLTTKQRETLLTAYQEGYFDRPRNVSQEELGDEFDVSRRAISERLRRGTRNLIADALLPEGGGN